MTGNKKLFKVRWGIIGCGDVTEVKSGPAFQKALSSELVAVMRRNEALAKDYATRHHVPKWYGNAQDLIQDSEVDAIYIATPPQSHLQYVVQAASAGKPVYCEKPMGLSYGECVQMLKVCELTKVPLFTAYYRRALPRFLKVKEIIESGIIGKIQEVNVRLNLKASEKDKNGTSQWRLQPEISGGGYFFDLGSHMIDLLMYFFGPIKKAKGFKTNKGKLYQAEDFVTANFEFESGLLGSGTWNFVADEECDKTEIIGSEGTVTFATFMNVPVYLKKNGKCEKFIIPHPEHIQQPLIQTIVDELIGEGVCPSNGQTGARTNWVIDQIFERC